MNSIFRLLQVSFLLSFTSLYGQELQLSEIMKGAYFLGISPTEIAWSPDSKQVYFNWNPSMQLIDQPFEFSLETGKTTNLNTWNPARLTTKHNSINAPFIYFSTELGIARYDSKAKLSKLVFEVNDNVTILNQNDEGTVVYFYWNQIVFSLEQASGKIQEIVRFEKKSTIKTKDDSFLASQQHYLFDYVRLQKEIQTQSDKLVNKPNFKKVKYDENEQVTNVSISPNGKILSFNLFKPAEETYTQVANYMHESGETKIEQARAKVHANEPSNRFGIFYLSEENEAQFLNFEDLPGVKTDGDYVLLYGQSKTLNEAKPLVFHTSKFNRTSSALVFDIRSYDNKDRWIVRIDTKTKTKILADYQHTESWIGGPGISSWNEEPGTLEWINQSQFVFQSEKSGYSHLYMHDIPSNSSKALTSGSWEVHDLIVSKNKEKLYILANKIHPGVRNGYVFDLKKNTLLPLFEGKFGIEWVLSPDESTWAIRYSEMMKPWELFVAPNKVNTNLKQITFSQTEEFKKSSLVTPELIEFRASDGVSVYARKYTPANPNGAAVMFVHGAGYLQNAHFYWSNYHREFLFNQLLTSKGYTILDIDYRASEGYGENYRTAIYRHMGERDLLDYIDGKDYLVKKCGIDSSRVGIYGGSYGGFITLMGLCKTPNEFACGAALRSVTDWAHYNHEYTSNILNSPEKDSLAYVQSSPIYYAEGLKNPLLMLHGMVDDNVQFQDVVRMNQRFIELGKKDFQLIGFPTEAHGFQYTPAWVDEYRRIFELFEKELKKPKQ